MEGSLYIHNHNDEPNMTDLSCFQNLREVKGNLEITGINLLPDLTGFSNLAKVGHNFLVSNPYAISLTGLEKLRYVGGDLTLKDMFYDDDPEDLEEFYNLDTIGGGIILSNLAITTLKPLVHSVIHGDLQLSKIKVLQAQDSLHVIDTVFGTFTVEDMRWTSLDGFSGLKHVGGLRLINNDSLMSVHILHEQDTVDRMIEIYGNDQLSPANGLEAIQHVGGEFQYSGPVCHTFTALSTVGGDCQLTTDSIDVFSNLSFVGGDLWIYGVDNVDLAEMSLLDTIHGDLVVAYTDVRSLYGLHQVEYVGGNLSISDNQSLLAIDALHTAMKVEGEWRMEYNSMLNLCNTPAFCNHIAAGGDYALRQNGPMCSDISSVICTSGTEHFDQEGLIVYPNPASETIYLKSDEGVMVDILDLTGSQIMSAANSISGISVSGIPSGLYTCRVITTGGIRVGQFFKTGG